MKYFALAATALPYLVFGGNLQEAIFNALRSNQNLEVQQCNVCPFTGPAIIQPGVPRSVPGCCSSNFEECPAGDGRCRLLGQYVIPEDNSPSNSVEVCPGVPEEGCTCQTALSASVNVSLKLCPTPMNCCETCRCIGDPHCTSFSGQPNSFVVCDVRDGNCDFPTKKELSAACAKIKFNGQQCVVRPDPTGKLFCQIPAGDTPPSMDMYSRTYVTPSGQTRDFKISLELSIYGSTSTVTINDGGKTYIFGLRFSKGKFSCVLPSTLSNIASNPHLEKGGFIHLDKLDSGVAISLQCIIMKHLWGTRWDVPKLEDDFSPNAAGRGGFCQTGLIPESSDQPTPCTIDRRLLGQFEQWGYTCKGSIEFTSSNGTDAVGLSTTYCKQAWCSKPLINTGKGSNWASAGFSSEQQCKNYVSGVGDNFLRAVCSVAPGVSVSGPSECDADADCKNCMDNLKDFPEEAADILQPATVPHSSTTGGSGSGNSGGGGGSCDATSLLELGIASAEQNDTISTGGVKLLYKANNSSDFIVIWQATDAEIAQFTSACGCIDFLHQSSDVLFTAAGTYQLQQCFPETQFVPNNCYAAPTYNLTATYPNTPFQPDFSFPFGELVNNNQLVCSTSEMCPPDSQCCIWQHNSPGWKDCLGDQASQFPNCGLKSVTCPGCPQSRS